MNNVALIDKEFKSILKKRGMQSIDMGSEISDSWARCISNGLDPFKGPKKSVISSQELDQIREEKEDLRKIVIPELELLYSQVAGTNFMVAFCMNSRANFSQLRYSANSRTSTGSCFPILLKYNITKYFISILISILISKQL